MQKGGGHESSTQGEKQSYHLKKLDIGELAPLKWSAGDENAPLVVANFKKIP